MPRVISYLTTWLGRPKHAVDCCSREEAEAVLHAHLVLPLIADMVGIREEVLRCMPDGPTRLTPEEIEFGRRLALEAHDHG